MPHSAILTGMDEELRKKIEEQGEKLNAIFTSVEKLRKYFLVTMWVTVLMVALPLIGLVFVIPLFLNTYLGTFEGLL